MRSVLLTACYLITLSALAQKRPDIDLEDFAERLFQVQDEDIDYESLYESLLLYYTNPINMNRTNPEELSSLYLLNPGQLNNFFGYLTERGPLLSLYELEAIPGFDVETIRNLLPFVTVDERMDNRPLLTRILSEPNNYLLLRYGRTVQKSEGYQRTDGSGYLGDANTVYGRFRVSHPNDFSLGMTFEKDAGEQWIINPQNQDYGPDYYSFHFYLQNRGKIKAFALGDYQLQFGQGLVFGAGFGAGKGAETVNTAKRSSLGVRPYSSALESGFFRGAAATLQLRHTEVTLLASRLLQDAQAQNDTSYSDYEDFINSIQSTGYHRTASELTSRNHVAETDGGIAIRQKFGRHFSAGINGLYTEYSRPIQKKPNNYNQYEFSGTTNYIGSIYTQYNWQNFILFGERALSRSGGNGTVLGLMASLTPHLDISWLYRNYDKDFHSFYGNAFSESSRNINEHGVYWGISFQPSARYRLTAYFDKFVFPWLKYRVDAPSEGFEYLGRFTWQPAKTIKVYVQFRQENKQLSVTDENANLSELVTTSKHNYILNADYAVGKFFSFKTRVQGSWYDQGNTRTSGIALVQDISLAFWKMKLSTRYALFDTDDYNNRQYVFEKNVLYAFSIPAYYGAGIRTYALLQYRLNDSWSYWLRYAIFDYTGQSSIGSGLDEIQGHRKSEIKLLLRYRFRD